MCKSSGQWQRKDTENSNKKHTKDKWEKNATNNNENRLREKKENLRIFGNEEKEK